MYEFSLAVDVLCCPSATNYTISPCSNNVNTIFKKFVENKSPKMGFLTLKGVFTLIIFYSNEIVAVSSALFILSPREVI